MTVAAAAVRGAAASRQPRGTSGAGGPAGSGPASRPSSAPSSGRAFPAVQPSAAVDSGAGFLLGALFWVWVGLPFLRGGMPEVRNVLRAKFFNKGADGTWLP